MINNGLFSKLFIDQVRAEVSLGEQGEARFATLTQLWQRRDGGSAEALWKTFVMKALSGLGFNPATKSEAPGFYPLCEQGTFDFQAGTVTMAYLIEPSSDIDDTRAGRFWRVKLPCPTSVVVPEHSGSMGDARQPM
jgi:hypothetical protein